jgi:hypothetical protein
MFNELLRGKYAPITSEMGFLNCDLKIAVEHYLDWQKPIQEKRGVELKATHLTQKFEENLTKLLPLTSVERRRVLLISSEGWTAYFDNGKNGGDPSSVISFLSRKIGCLGVRAAYVPHSLDREDGIEEGRYGGTIFELFGSEKTEFLNTIRSVACAFDGNKWKFSEFGALQPYENPEKYNNKNIKDKFTPELLQEYLRALGIDAFNEDYFNSGNACLIEKNGPCASAMEEFSLAQVQSSYSP